MSKFDELPNRIHAPYTVATKSLGMFNAMLIGFIVGIALALTIWLFI